tara:strand:+ start:1504 stop:2052 length:549 start_codon:yes stop_codon:yes gene_type:complete
MFLIKRFFLISFILQTFILSSCSQIRESAGVNRKSIDEFQAVENPPLVIPPDFNLVSPDNIDEKNIDDVDKELAKEILFGLDEKTGDSKKESSTINTILSKSKAETINDEIRKEIDQEFAEEKDTNSIFGSNWKNEKEVLDAVKESERIRNSNFEGKSITEGEIPTTEKEIKPKKKKRFIFF